MSGHPRQEWYSAAELAALGLPGIPGTKAGVLARANAESWQSRPRAGRGGGSEYHYSALPVAAQVRLTLDAQPVAKPEVVAVADGRTRDQLWEWFATLPDNKKKKAARRLEILDAVNAMYDGGIPKDVAVAEAANHFSRQGDKATKATIYNWFGLVEGRDRADWLPALAPKHAGSTERVECPPEAWDMIKSDYLRNGQSAFSECYERLERAAKPLGWAIPSERTLWRRLNATVHPTVITLCRKGREALKQMYPAQERDRSHFHALEAINGDGHRWDVWVEWPDGEICRPNMVAFQDLYSGMMLSWRIDKTANSWAVRLAIGDLVEQYGIPRACWLDNGRDFASKWLTGGVPNRYRFKVRDDEPAGILTQLGVDIHWTTPYSGQSKPIERGFRDFANTIARHPEFEGAYTGNSPVNKPENYRSRAIPLQRFEAVIRSEINQHNDRLDRRAANCKGRSFRQTFDASYAVAPITKATEEQRRLWLLAAEGVTVNSRDGTVKLMGNRYFAEFLHLHLGDKVAVRFDPDYLHDGVHIYALSGVYLGMAPVIEAVGFDSAEAAQAHGRARKTWMRAAKLMAEAEVRMSAAQVAKMIPPNLGPEAPPEATVVALARPVLDLRPKIAPAPMTPDQEARHAAVVREFAAPAPVVKDERAERLKRAQAIAADLAAGRTVAEAEAKWFESFSRTAQWQAHLAMVEEFADARAATA